MERREIANANSDRTFIKPGFGFIPNQAAKLWSVVGSGVVVTLYDAQRRMGGMTHFARPYRQEDQPSTAMFAAPAILWLLSQFAKAGSKAQDLEAQVIGGASNPTSPDYQDDLHENNVNVSLEILQKKGVKVAAVDVGGKRGRKVVFNTLSGETAVLKVSNIRNNDWYPQLNAKNDDARPGSQVAVSP